MKMLKYINFTMGYNTEFTGCFKIDKPLDEITIKKLDLICNTRRMARNLIKIGLTQEEEDKYGCEGEFFDPGNDDPYTDEIYKDASILDKNTPPKTQPGLWCEWKYNRENNCIEWNGNEKFHYFVAWIIYLIKKVLEPHYLLNGEIKFQGDDNNDHGTIIINNNKVSVYRYENGPDCVSDFLNTHHDVCDLYNLTIEKKTKIPHCNIF